MKILFFFALFVNFYTIHEIDKIKFGVRFVLINVSRREETKRKNANLISSVLSFVDLAGRPHLIHFVKLS